MERRPARELSWDGSVGELGKGVLVGAGFLAAVVGLVAAFGFYQVVTVHRWTAVLAPLAIAVMSGYTEEIMFRGVLLRIAEESLGTWLALLISSVLFGVVHASNPGATVLEAGVLLGAVFLVLAHRRGHFMQPFWSSAKSR